MDRRSVLLDPDVLEEARHLRAQSLRTRQGLGVVVDRLAVERAVALRAIRALYDTLNQTGRPPGEE